MDRNQSEYQLPQQTALPLAVDYARHGVAIIGAGAIVATAHLPAYQKMNARVEGIFDLSIERARNLAQAFGIPRVYESVEALMADGDVNIVDIAVPPVAQEVLAPQVSRAGKHLLCQKPLARSGSVARGMVSLFDEVGVRAALNVNMRWAPAIRAVKALLEKQALGSVRSASFHINFWDDWKTWPWLADVPRLLIAYDTIHLIDAIRYLFGEAEHVYAVAAGREGLRGESAVTLIFKMRSGARVVIHDSSDNWARDTDATFRIEGTAAMVRGKMGLWYDYPDGVADRLELCRANAVAGWEAVNVAGRWMPDAWAWTMGELMSAIDENRVPTNDARDHITTIDYVEACYESVAREQVVSLISGRQASI